jgi:hypothetical protein
MPFPFPISSAHERAQTSLALAWLIVPCAVCLKQDGVEEAFYYTDKVFCVSFHHYAPGFYPGTVRAYGMTSTCVACDNDEPFISFSFSLSRLCVSCFVLPHLPGRLRPPRHGADYPGGRRQGQVLQYRPPATYSFRSLLFAIFACVRLLTPPRSRLWCYPILFCPPQP